MQAHIGWRLKSFHLLLVGLKKSTGMDLHDKYEWIYIPPGGLLIVLEYSSLKLLLNTKERKK